MVRALASACSPCLHSVCSAALRAACSPCLYPHACLLTCRHACHPIKFSSPPHARALSLFPGRNLSLARPLQEHCGGASSLNPMPCMHPQSRASGGVSRRTRASPESSPPRVKGFQIQFSSPHARTLSLFQNPNLSLAPPLWNEPSSHSRFQINSSSSSG